jgi:uncharacterized Zn finger protein
MAWDGYGYGDWAPYVPVAERRRRAMKKMDALRKKGVDIQPVRIDGRKIAKSFWGEAWCEHLESFSDFENRLPRGRTYVRNGSVCHLAMAKGRIEAKVSGSELYEVKVHIKTLPGKKWETLKGRCGGQIGSLLELLQGRLSDHVMEVVTHREEGLFPLPGEMSFTCSCPDWAGMCKHVAAVLYGVGARLDNKPELLFALRGVNHEELIEADAEKAMTAATSRGKSKRLAETELGEVFGIELNVGGTSPSESTSRKTTTAAPAASTRPKRLATLKVVKTRHTGAAKKESDGAAAVPGKVVEKPRTSKKVSGAAARSKAQRTKRRSPKMKVDRRIMT